MLHFARIIGLLGTLLISAQVLAVGLGDLSGKEASAGLKEALSRGADMAVSQLGKPNGFMGDARVRIPLPKSLRAAEKMMRTLGMKKQADELIETMNRAAELAVVEAKPILLESVQKMTIDDARGILAGGDDAATQYFRRTTSTALGKKFLPIVKQATAKVQLADQYNEYAGQAAKLGLLEEKDANLDSYVTQKALDGLFVMIAEQEKSIRQDPVGTGSKLLQTVFGAVGK
ncbi:DUF4197 domain-containing protein [Accumulibacter sp.]|uniref:DUF4197 domain-containing protein n=1 Tax=Accumulibacter sp. TaxID=2053492 RepID=UPI002605C931|nr:DUF4197 domain-containing protein [Accumulibacter sp.]